jgi:DNA-binding response OmpR family regulator
LRILLVEDDRELSAGLSTRLNAEGYVVDCVRNLKDAIEAVIMNSYRAVLLDRRLPDGDGVALLPVLATRVPVPPALILSALDDLPDRVAGIEAGADDYLIKPFAFEELKARLLIRIQRAPDKPALPPIRIGRVVYNLLTRDVQVGEEDLQLSRRELAVLDTLVRRAGRVVLREDLEANVYGIDDDISSNALEAHVSRLRRRLMDANAGVLLHVVRGVGYMLKVAP